MTGSDEHYRYALALHLRFGAAYAERTVQHMTAQEYSSVLAYRM